MQGGEAACLWGARRRPHLDMSQHWGPALGKPLSTPLWLAASPPPRPALPRPAASALQPRPVRLLAALPSAPAGAQHSWPAISVSLPPAAVAPRVQRQRRATQAHLPRQATLCSWSVALPLVAAAMAAEESRSHVSVRIAKGVGGHQGALGRSAGGPQGVWLPRPLRAACPFALHSGGAGEETIHTLLGGPASATGQGTAGAGPALGWFPGSCLSLPSSSAASSRACGSKLAGQGLCPPPVGHPRQAELQHGPKGSQSLQAPREQQARPLGGHCQLLGETPQHWPRRLRAVPLSG